MNNQTKRIRARLKRLAREAVGMRAVLGADGTLRSRYSGTPVENLRELVRIPGQSVYNRES